MTDTQHRVQLTPTQLEVVTSIVREHFPDAQVWVFGSRARRDARPASDLDLLLADAGPIELPAMWRLADALEESTLPFRVDVVDRARIDESFWRAIEKELVPLPGPDPERA